MKFAHGRFGPICGKDAPFDGSNIEGLVRHYGVEIRQLTAALGAEAGQLAAALFAS